MSTESHTVTSRNILARGSMSVLRYIYVSPFFWQGERESIKESFFYRYREKCKYQNVLYVRKL